MENVKSIQQQCKTYGTDVKSGLTDDKVLKNRQKYGENKITKTKGKTFFKRLTEALFEPMLIILEFAWVVTFGVNVGKTLKTGDGDFYECIGIFIAIAISVTLTLITEGKSQKAFEVLNTVYDNTTVRVIRNGKIEVMQKEELVVGDVVVYDVGEKICADGIIIDCQSLSVDESMLTGESRPAEKDKTFKSNENTPLAERKDTVYSGTLIVSGNCKVLVTAVGDKAEVGLIAGELMTENTVSAPLNEKLSRLGKLISVIGVVSAIIVFTLAVTKLVLQNNVTFESVETAFIQAIVLIVAAVPEGLPTTVAVSLSLNVVKLAKSNALIKKLVAAETVGCVSVICSDKTGTLTENAMKVDGIVCDKKSEKFIIENICVNSVAEIGLNGLKTGSTTECALLEYVKNKGVDYNLKRRTAKITEVIPFTSQNKYMITKVSNETASITYIKGAFEKLSAMCGGDGYYYAKSIEKAQCDGKRVLCFAHKTGDKCEFDGYAVIEDPLRKDVYESVNNCLNAGIDVKILTGDNINTARSIAEQLNLLEGDKKVVTAETVDNLGDETLKKLLPEITVIARSTPSTKLRVVRLLKESGEVVAVTGDGINDAPAIKHADIGISMGDGSEIAKEASDIILLDNSFSTIVKAISFGRNIYKNFQSFIMFQLTVNVTAVLVIITTLLLGMETPFTTLQLLWINIIMDGPPALSLGLKMSEQTHLNDEPVKRSDNIVSKKMLFRIIMHGVVITSVIILQSTTNFLGLQPEMQKTAVFTLFTLFQLMNAINCKEVGSKSIMSNFKENKLILIVTFATFIVQAVLTQYFGRFFGTVKMDLVTWLKIIGTSTSVIIVSEIYKAVYRFFRTRQNSHVKKVKPVNEKKIYCIE